MNNNKNIKQSKAMHCKQ